ncbi:MAG: S1C family serine protease, partial [Rhodospirillaceae bacterium]
LENPSCPIPEVLDPGLWRDIQREEAPNLDLWRALIGRSAPPLRERLLPSGQGALGQTAPSGQQDQAPSLPSPNARSQDTGQADQTAPQTDPTLTESLPEPQGEPHGNPDQTGTLESLSNRDLGALLESATVFVLGLDPDGEDASTGSGFFISERLIVTNRHVIEDADQNYLLVTSARMGTVQKARLVATSPSSDIGGEDFAVLALEDGRAPGFVALAQEDRKLTEVVAAGYPGLSLRGDEGFSRLVEGDLTAAPDLNMNSGEIRSLQSLGEINRIVHTADVLKGNSGGPLFDRCGRVIGVNTFVQVDKDQAGRLNNAIETGDLLAFLARHGLSASVDQRTCAP